MELVKGDVVLVWDLIWCYRQELYQKATVLDWEEYEYDGFERNRVLIEFFPKRFGLFTVRKWIQSSEVRGKLKRKASDEQV